MVIQDNVNKNENQENSPKSNEIKRLLSAMHQVANNIPEQLDQVITNQVLILAIQDIDKNLKQYFEYYINAKKYSKQKFEYESDKLQNDNIMHFSIREVLSYYKIYLAYEKVRESRSIEITLETDIEFVKEVLINNGLLKSQLYLKK